MIPPRVLRTGRLVLSPVAWGDLQDLLRLKADPRVFGQMLGGVRGPAQVAAELAEDTAFWARHGTGMWMVRPEGDGAAIGLVGVHERPDGRGVALRFAFTPESRGRGLAREAAGAALRHAHERGRTGDGRLGRIVGRGEGGQHLEPDGARRDRDARGGGIRAWGGAGVGV